MKNSIIDSHFVDDICRIINEGQAGASKAVVSVAITTYWNIGKRIVEEEQCGAMRAQYGKRIVSELAEKLKTLYGAGYGKRNLAYYRKFYLVFPNYEILHTCVQNLSWSHIRLLIHIENEEERHWYLTETISGTWSVRTLERNIASQYYGRRLLVQRAAQSSAKTKEDARKSPENFIKNPLIADFLQFHQNSRYTETQLEQALIDNLQQFILELGKGFAFVERQKHIRTETGDFFIDLVFYNYKMKWFVLFELKTHQLTHADIGQLDMYVRMYDDLECENDDNPTIGVLLCTDTDTTVARYSVLHESEQLFAAKYMTYMPSEEELKNVIESQKRFYQEQTENVEIFNFSK